MPYYFLPFLLNMFEYIKDVHSIYNVSTDGGDMRKKTFIIKFSTKRIWETGKSGYTKR